MKEAVKVVNKRPAEVEESYALESPWVIYPLHNVHNPRFSGPDPRYSSFGARRFGSVRRRLPHLDLDTIGRVPRSLRAEWVPSGFFNFQGCHSFSPLFGAGGLDIKADWTSIISLETTHLPPTDNMTPSIIATCKQTRFHLLDDNASQEVNPIHWPFSLTIVSR